MRRRTRRIRRITIRSNSPRRRQKNHPPELGWRWLGFCWLWLLLAGIFWAARKSRPRKLHRLHPRRQRRRRVMSRQLNRPINSRLNRYRRKSRPKPINRRRLPARHRQAPALLSSRPNRRRRLPRHRQRRRRNRGNNRQCVSNRRRINRRLPRRPNVSKVRFGSREACAKTNVNERSDTP